MYCAAVCTAHFTLVLLILQDHMAYGGRLVYDK